MGYSDSKSTKNSGGISISGFFNWFIKCLMAEKKDEKGFFGKNGTDFEF